MYWAIPVRSPSANAVEKPVQVVATTCCSMAAVMRLGPEPDASVGAGSFDVVGEDDGTGPVVGEDVPEVPLVVDGDPLPWEEMIGATEPRSEGGGDPTVFFDGPDTAATAPTVAPTIAMTSASPINGRAHPAGSASREDCSGSLDWLAS